MKRKSKLTEGLILPPTWRLVAVQPEWTKPDWYAESPNRELKTPVVTSVERAIRIARRIDADHLDGKMD